MVTVAHRRVVYGKLIICRFDRLMCFLFGLMQGERKNSIVMTISKRMVVGLVSFITLLR